MEGAQSRGTFWPDFPDAGDRSPRWFATDTCLGFNATVAPPELEKGKNLLLFRHLQVIGHRHPSRDEPLRMSETAYPKWPVFRRSCLAAFSAFANTNGTARFTFRRYTQVTLAASN
jgi:hypothetical protein